MWAELTKGKRGQSTSRPDFWATTPAITITKNAVVFNNQFVMAFGFEIGDHIRVHLDVSRQRIGFAHAKTKEEVERAWTIQPNGGGNRAGLSRHRIAIAKVAKTFPHTVGKSYTVKLSISDSFIVGELAEESKPELVA